MNLHINVIKHTGVCKGDRLCYDDFKDIENIFLNSKDAFLLGAIYCRIITMGAFKKSENELA